MSSPGLNCKSRHQSLYKGKPEKWKETFRQRCLERLRDSRSKLFLSRRKVLNTCDLDSELDVDGNCQKDGQQPSEEVKEMMDIQDIMKNEWDLMQKTVEDPSSTIDEMISLFEEVQADLKEEEMRLLQDQAMCDEFLKKEENDLCRAIQRLHTVEVVCPMCEKNLLMLNKGVILCICGLRINTEQDSVNLKNVQDNLNAGLNEHSGKCDSKPAFSQGNQFGFSNLIISCQDCDFLFIVV